MADWLLLTKAVLLVCLPCCVLIYTLLSSATFSRVSTYNKHPCKSLLHTPANKLPHSERVVLVTGAAGFVGYHISRTLISQWRATVVGLDSYTKYYDVQLKLDRSNELVKAGVTFYRGDVCDRQLLLYLFRRYNFTDVVHMAAQAGIRHSLDDPTTYVKTNTQCFLVLLDTLREFQEVNYANVWGNTRGQISNRPCSYTISIVNTTISLWFHYLPIKNNLSKLSQHTSLVYASTSSVYGNMSPLPFSTSTRPHTPTNIYAASKMTNEHFSSAYCSEYGIRSIGIRLFTVYGPWGRPDMAVYKFTDSIANGRPITMFTSSQPLLRDFTFVNDSVGVILAALNHTPQCCGEVYNAGLSQPTSLGTLIVLLEEEFDTKANITTSPLLPCDLHQTWADMEDTKRVLGYKPNVVLKDGLRTFVHWYKEYHRNRERDGASKRNGELEEVLLGGEREVAAAHRKELDSRNRQYRQRVHKLREKYVVYARNRGFQLPNLKKEGFIYIPGIESPGHTVIKAHGYQGNQKLLEQRCLATEQCVGFTTRADFKNQLAPMERWDRSPKGHGMFVADMDLCAADLHSCGKNADCVYTGPANYSCVCHHDYVKLGTLCVEKFVEDVVGTAEKTWILSDQFDGLDWEQTVNGKQFVFFQGLDSPGGDYLVVEGENVDTIKKACLSTRHCLGFNTNGILKDSIRPPKNWIRWAGPEYTKHGIYVLDIDYCSMNVEKCPQHSSCQKHSPAKYSCSCQSPWVTSHIDDTCTLDQIHIILSTDPDHLPGLVGVVSSTLSHASNPDRLVFHIVFIGTEQAIIESYLGCYGYRDHAQIDIVLFDSSMFQEHIKVYSRISNVGNLASLGNFARFYFHILFPDLSRVIYLDVDMVVVGDIGEVWQQVVSTDKLLVAAPRDPPTYGDLLSTKVNKMFKERYGTEFDSEEPSFNAGVYGVNLDLWREGNLHGKVTYWMEQQAKEPLWRYGTQPVLLLVVYGRWEHLDSNWNINGLGWNNDISANVLNKAKILHWSGRRKPWLEDGLYKELWADNHPPACSGHGNCVVMDTTDYVCQCGDGYTGKHCSET